MWGSYTSVFTLLITLDAVLGQNNETGQEQNDYVTVGGRAFMSGNFSGNISVSDAVVNDSYIVGSSGNLVEFNTASARDNRTIKLLKDFRPSPPINYEFNKFPVRPVYPEAKTFSTRIPSEDQRRFTKAHQNTDRVIVDWNPISTRVKFPVPTDHNDSPFVTKFTSPPPNYYETVPPTQGKEFNFNKLVEVPKKYYPYDKTVETYNIMERPYYSVGKSHQGSSSWKKILKVLATFIPIGLLISALTPTVITVTNVNDTGMMESSRYRSTDNPKQQLHNHLLSSLEYFDKLNENGCELMVFCELLVVASQMPDSEKHVKNLLDNFANQDVNYKKRAEELRKVFDAVRNQNCAPITCNDPD